MVCKDVRQRRKRPGNFLRLRYKKEQHAYIKIECLRCNTVPLITANLSEACSHDAVNRSTVA